MTNPHLDQEIILSLKEIMGDDFNDLIETYIRDSEQRLNECVTAFQQKDLEKLQFSSHALKGASANIGAATLASLCSQVETSTKQGDINSVSAPLAQIQSLYPEVVQALTRL
jgi:HPt (histidine-containing phosphotransfer) domain-containing protein